jgi:hypothetical protein
MMITVDHTFNFFYIINLIVRINSQQQTPARPPVVAINISSMFFDVIYMIAHHD